MAARIASDVLDNTLLHQVARMSHRGMPGGSLDCLQEEHHELQRDH
jgi:hypothetical protein